MSVLLCAALALCAPAWASAWTPSHASPQSTPDEYLRLCVHPSIDIYPPVPADVVCSGRGECAIGDDGGWRNAHCVCQDIYSGDFCEQCSELAVAVNGSCLPRACAWDLATGEVTECSNAGECVYDGQNYSCQCSPGAFRYGRTCAGLDCLRGEGHGLLCSGHGYCNYGMCWCLQGHSGKSCERTDGTCPEDEVYVQDLRICASRLCLPTGEGARPGADAVWSAELCGEGGSCEYDPQQGWHCECTRFNCTVVDNVCYCSEYSRPVTETERALALAGNVCGGIGAGLVLAGVVYGLATFRRIRFPSGAREARGATGAGEPEGAGDTASLTSAQEQ